MLNFLDGSRRSIVYDSKFPIGKTFFFKTENKEQKSFTKHSLIILVLIENKGWKTLEASVQAPIFKLNSQFQKAAFGSGKKLNVKDSTCSLKTVNKLKSHLT